ncbi:LADA_0C03048g1_1 [Lachancea dasiensis]|uniref:LADA_0C03048g1_1 n=1 Tax=Lachancea dasiensis TaxID=1072105 RepID=A0A1G4IYC2_9SACH|nr:LADA_0C03048g1_1 [Lachancea dasiensis]
MDAQLWHSWVATQSVSEELANGFIQQFQRRNMDVSTINCEYSMLNVRQIDVNIKGLGNLIVCTRDDGDLQQQFQTCFLSDREQLGMAFRNWVAENTTFFVERVVFGNALISLIADYFLKQRSQAIKIIYMPTTHDNHLKKLQVDFSQPDVEALREGQDGERVFSELILPYLYDQTGIRAEKLPMAEVRVHHSVLVRSDGVKILGNDKHAIAGTTAEILAFVNTQCKSAEESLITTPSE